MSNLTQFLRTEHRLCGLTLQDEDKPPHRMFLLKDGTVVGEPFDRYATLVEIHHRADQILNNSKSGISFVKEVSNGY